MGRRRPVHGDPAMSWERKALRATEFVACPALAGAAFCLLALGAVTWLPALAAAANSLQTWRTDGAARCFTGTLRAFSRHWHALWRESIAGTAAAGVLVVNALFLWDRNGPALVLLPVQVVLLAALVLYALALATVAAAAPEDPKGWRRAATAFAFGSPRRAAVLLAAATVLPLAVVPIPLGPLLLGPTLPLMLALSLHAPADPRIRKVSHA